MQVARVRLTDVSDASFPDILNPKLGVRQSRGRIVPHFIVKPLESFVPVLQMYK